MKEINQMPLSERLKILIKIFGISQREFCAKAGIDAGSFNRALSGMSVPRFDTIEAIYLANPEINSHWLLTGEGEPLGSAPIIRAPDQVSILEREVAHLQDMIKMKDEIISLLKSK